MMNNESKVTATDTTIASIDNNLLVTVSGGVRPGPNGEGCTGPGCGGPFGPRPRPRPTFPPPSGPVVDPLPQV
jgi:hypothetical protein